MSVDIKKILKSNLVTKIKETWDRVNKFLIH